MKHVLVVIQTPIFGGPHNQVLQLAEPLERLGWRSTIVLPEEPGNAAERLRLAGLDVLELQLHRLRRRVDPRTHLRFVANLRREVDSLRRVIDSKAIDLVQICGLMQLQGPYAARSLGVPIVWQLLGTFAPKAVRLLFMPLVTRWAQVVMSAGADVARQHPGAASLGERLVTFLPPVDLNRFRPNPAKRHAARRELRVPDDAFLVGTLGNFGRPKRHETLVQAASRLIHTSGDVYVRIMGAPTPAHEHYYRRCVVNEAVRLGLRADDRLSFVDPGDRVADLLPAIDVFVLTSDAEGISTALLEAMACGIPAIATDVGSTSEALHEEYTGFLIPPGQPDALVERLSLLRRDANLRARLGLAARREAERSLGTNRCAGVHARAYAQALQQGR